MNGVHGAHVGGATDFPRLPYGAPPYGYPDYRIHHLNSNGHHRDEIKPMSGHPDLREDEGFSDHAGTYELDHLATFTVGRKQGLVSAQDGMRKLRQMEMSTGIWTMRCHMLVEPKFLLILERSSGEEMERFPLSLIAEPVAMTNRDRHDVYNNILMFSVREDSAKGSPAEMHIFQVISRPAQAIVNEIREHKSGRGRNVEVPARYGVRDRVGIFEGMKDGERAAVLAESYPSNGPRPSAVVRQAVQREADAESVLSERTDRDVQMLNHCFDDIERFVGQLQQAAQAYRELDRRRRDNRRSQNGNGLLSVRARPPPAKKFIDIFQKFKLSFNLLAKLKGHIHDPNAPELVHFLFTPLSLVVEASKDQRNGPSNIANKVLSPLITPEAKDLLQNCLSSKESELWMSLGDAWTVSSEHWKSYVPPYFPRFVDGWSPAPNVLDEQSTHTVETALMAQHLARSEHHTPQHHRPEQHRELYYPSEPEAGRLRGADLQHKYPPAEPLGDKHERADFGDGFLRELHHAGARIVEVLADRIGQHPKELSVHKGQILELLDDKRNWWKLRNSRGDVGHAPFTILQRLLDDGMVCGK